MADPAPGPFLSRLAQLFGEALDREPYATGDNFFSAGGDSLAGTALLLEVEHDYQVELTYRDLIEAPTPEALALTVLRASAERGEEVLAALLDKLSAEEAERLLARLDER